jgi:hypothetical protein
MGSSCDRFLFSRLLTSYSVDLPHFLPSSVNLFLASSVSRLNTISFTPLCRSNLYIPLRHPTL